MLNNNKLYIMKCEIKLKNLLYIEDWTKYLVIY